MREGRNNSIKIAMFRGRIVIINIPGNIVLVVMLSDAEAGI